MRIHERIKQLDNDRKDLVKLVQEMLSAIALEKNHSGTVGDMHKELAPRWAREFKIISAVDPGDL